MQHLEQRCHHNSTSYHSSVISAVQKNPITSSTHPHLPDPARIAPPKFLTRRRLANQLGASPVSKGNLLSREGRSCSEPQSAGGGGRRARKRRLPNGGPHGSRALAPGVVSRGASPHAPPPLLLSLDTFFIRLSRAGARPEMPLPR